MQMLKEVVFFVEQPEKRAGGIVVCGLNFGVDNNHALQIDEDPDKIERTKTFYLPSEAFQLDTLRKYVGSLFDAWIPELNKNEKWDRAFLPTNLFYNFTSGISEKGFKVGKNVPPVTITDTEWDSAASRLFSYGDGRTKPAGYLFVGKTARHAIGRYLRRLSGVDDVAKFWRPDTPKNIEIIEYDNLNIAIIDHYRYARRRNKVSKTKDQYQNVSQAMKSWLEDVFKRHQSMARPEV